MLGGVAKGAELNWRSVPFVVVDAEGSGHRPPELIEFAAMQGQGTGIHPVHSWLIRPKQPISPFAARVHGITDSDVTGAPTLDNVSRDILEIINDRHLVAHNASVEKNILSRELPGWRPTGIVDTIALSKKAFPGLPSYGLDALAEHLHIQAPGSRHRASHDVLLTAAILRLTISKLIITGREGDVGAAFGITNQESMF